ncbi:MAG: hypothetical protein WC554_08535 [Clostridia bacterium]
MATTQPITPEEVVEFKQKQIPDEVIHAFNELIALNFNGYSATIIQKDMISLLEKRGFDRDIIFNHHLLDIEDIYRAAGWEVKYDKPAYCESYDAYFEFRRGK